MVTLAQIRKQISALEAQAAEITKSEMAGAIAKVKELMASYGLTAEHLGFGGARGRIPKTAATAAKGAATAVKATRAKRAGAGQAKYRDPASGKTWTGFGRVPGWMAGAKSRDAFLIDHVGGAAGVTATADAPAKPTAKRVSKKGAGAAAKKVTRASKKAVQAIAAPERLADVGPPAKKLPSKKASAKRAVPKKVAAKKAPAKKVGAKKASPAKKAAAKKVAPAKKAVPAKKAAPVKRTPPPKRADTPAVGAPDGTAEQVAAS